MFITLATLLCLLIGPGGEGDKYYNNLESCLLKHIRTFCLVTADSSSPNYTKEKEEIAILSLHCLTIAVACTASESVTSRPRRGIIKLCESILEGSLREAHKGSGDSKGQRPKKGGVAVEECDEWSLDSDDEPQPGREEGPVSSSGALKAEAAACWSVLTAQHRDLQPEREEEEEEQWSQVFSTCVQELLLPSSAREVRGAACRAVGYLLQLGPLDRYPPEDTEPLQRWLSPEKGRTKPGKASSEPQAPEMLQLREFLDSEASSQLGSCRLQAEEGGEPISLPLRSFAALALVDLLRALLRDGFFSAPLLLPSLRPVLGLREDRVRAAAGSGKWDHQGQAGAAGARVVVEKGSQADKRRAALRRQDRMARLQDLDLMD
eukprot:CAMPEP_0170067998 /NCGR_PEP_ID=MMETSP0019_2-20121128/7123_1 /TAXON_ID=98059 /ORGANISM="Dinobryon sp., Strain UTEXLB2267" /LENGTH=377 /DNA_ID=CAMNT_0010275503 /DNA_START=264 /DNA_END=1397 /DNA_ORIENTATION=+